MATKRMLVDAIHPEETRVVVTSGNRLEEFDFESAQRQQLRGNIYLAKVTRVEPSLQAAFVEYGGNRHGFLAFSEIHPDYYQIPVADREALLRDEEAENDHAEAEHAEADAATPSVSAPVEGENGDDNGHHDDDAHDHEDDGEHGHIQHVRSGAETVESVGGGDTVEEEVRERRRHNVRKYKIQEVIKRRQVMLVQVVKEERGNKGAALTTYLSLAGRYSVLMPNTARGGGISRKITSAADRKRLKEIVGDLEVPNGMGIILRTAGASRTKAEVKRDFEYLTRLWENVRSLTLKSQAPCLVYEEGSLIKRTIRDLYNKEIDELHVAGEEAHREAKDFMRMIMPSHAKNVQLYKEDQPLFSKYNVEQQLDQMFSPQVTLPSGGYIVINPTEALVSIDVNSGRATKEHNIEDTALQTNLEAAEEISRQLRLRDLAGLIVIDFIDMMENRSNRAVERKLKDCLKNDRARIQVGRISHFGLMEMSRQRIRFGVIESSTVSCPTCKGTGIVRSVESLALMVMRQVEDHVMRRPGQSINVRVPVDVALYILNTKRDTLTALENKYDLSITISADSKVHGSEFAIDKGEPHLHRHTERRAVEHVRVDTASMDELDEAAVDEEAEEEEAVEAVAEAGEEDHTRRRRRRRRRGEHGEDAAHAHHAPQPAIVQHAEAEDETGEAEGEADGEGEETRAGDAHDSDEPRKRRRRGRRGGRRNRREGERSDAEAPAEAAAAEAVVSHVGELAEAAASAEAEAEAPIVAEGALPHGAAADAGDVEPASTESASLEEPEAPAKPKRASRARKPKVEAADAAAEASVAEAAPEPAAEAVEAAEEAPAKPKRAPRARKPKVEAAEAAAPAAVEAAPEPTPEVAPAEPAEAAEPRRRPRKELPPEGIIATSSTPVAPAEEASPEEQKKKKGGWWQRGFLGS